MLLLPKEAADDAKSAIEACDIRLDVRARAAKWPGRFHLEGDECLKMVAYTLKNLLKRGTDLVARWGGEEFA